MGRRYVVLQFDDGDRFDYEPPLPHPADVFLERFPVSQQLNADIGAARVFEVDPIVAEHWTYEGPGLVLHPPRPVDRQAEFRDAMKSWAKRAE